MVPWVGPLVIAQNLVDFELLLAKYKLKFRMQNIKREWKCVLSTLKQPLTPSVER